MRLLKVSVSAILILTASLSIASPVTPSALPAGARVLPGDLSQNEFYILGANEQYRVVYPEETAHAAKPPVAKQVAPKKMLALKKPHTMKIHLASHSTHKATIVKLQTALHAMKHQKTHETMLATNARTRKAVTVPTSFAT